MSKKAKTPAAPDFTGLAKQQHLLDKESIGEATTANRVNQTNPFGALSWQQDPATGKWSQDVSLNAADQSNLDAMRGITGNLTGQAEAATADPFDISGAPDMPDSGFGAVQEIQDAMMSRMAPDLLRQRQRQEAQLIAQGVGGNTNSEAWDRAQQDLGRNENDASMQALLAGAQEYGNIYDRGMGNRNQWLTEQTAMRQLPLQELTAMLRNQQSYAAPQFEGFYQQQTGTGADILGAGQQQYGAAVDAANAKAQAKSNTMGTIGSIAGTAAGIFF